LDSEVSEGRQRCDSCGCLRISLVRRIGQEAGALRRQQRCPVACQKPLSQLAHARQASAPRTASERVDGFAVTPFGVVLFRESEIGG
jgi:hypothetical protein